MSALCAPIRRASLSFMRKIIERGDRGMKIAATDFDGTFRPIDQPVPEENLAAVRAWQAAGHKFGIATGRGLPLIEEGLAPYDIRVDFLVCNNGAVSVDADRRMIHCLPIPSAVVKQLLDLPAVRENDLPLLIFTAREAYSIRPNPAMSMALVRPLTFEAAPLLSDVVQVSMKLNTPEEAQQVSDDIHAHFPMLGGNINRSYLDINRAEADKGWGLMKMMEDGPWRGRELLVIGDDKNDLKMIRRFHGFTVRTARPFMQDAACGVYDTVGSMLRDHL